MIRRIYKARMPDPARVTVLILCTATHMYTTVATAVDRIIRNPYTVQDTV